MELVERYAPRFGVNAALRAVHLAKATWHYRRHLRRSYADRHRRLRRPLLAIATAHPHYGYRRVRAELRARGIRANHKVLRKLHKTWDLAVLRAVRRPRPSAIRRAIREMKGRVNLVRNITHTEPFDVLYTDFTENTDSFFALRKFWVIASIRGQNQGNRIRTFPVDKT